jgi:hypothetical protein
MPFRAIGDQTRRRRAPARPQELVELRAPGPVGGNHLAVENGLVDGEPGRHLLTQGGEAIEDVAAP